MKERQDILNSDQTVSHNEKKAPKKLIFPAIEVSLFFSITSESHPFCPITNGKSGRAARLNPFYPYSSWPSAQSEVSSLGLWKFPVSEAVWAPQCRRSEYFYTRMSNFFLASLMEMYWAPSSNAVSRFHYTSMAVGAAPTRPHQINCNQTSWHQSGCTDVGTQLSEA